MHKGIHHLVCRLFFLFPFITKHLFLLKSLSSQPLRSTWMHHKSVALLVWFVFCHPRKAIHGPEIQQQPTGQEESELASDKELDGSLTSYQSQQGVLSPLPASGKKTHSLKCDLIWMRWQELRNTRLMGELTFVTCWQWLVTLNQHDFYVYSYNLAC